MKSVHIYLLGFLLMMPGVLQAQLFERPIILEGVKMISPRGEVLEDLMITIRRGRIAGISQSGDAPMMSKKIAADGLFVTSGLVDHASVLTLPLGGEGAADHWSWDAFDRYDKEAILSVLATGVTRVHLVPVRSGGISGRSCWVSLEPAGENAASSGQFGVLMEEEAALCIDLASGSPVARMRSYAAILDQFSAAKDRRDALESYDEDLEEYLEELKKWIEEKAEEGDEESSDESAEKDEKKDEKKDGEEEENKGPEKPVRPGDDEPSDILLKVVAHQLPVLITARKSADLINACELIQKFELDAIIHGADEAALVMDHLNELENVSFILDNPANALSASGPGVIDGQPRRSADLISVMEENDLDWVIGSGGSGAGLWRMTRKMAGSEAALSSAQTTNLRGEKTRRDWVSPGMRHLVLWSGNPASDAAARPEKILINGLVVWQRPAGTREGRF